MGIVISFLVIHFTDLVTYGGLDFDDIINAKKPFLPLIYLGTITIPALAVSSIIPWAIKWIKAGE
jgi:hypothetical protein